MRTHLITITLLLSAAIVSAQQLEHRSILAHYPFTADANDAAGNYGPAELINAPIQGAEGVYSNGNYIGVDPDSCLIRTPAISAIDTSDLAISVEFKISEVPSQGAPIFVLGDSWRWLGARVNFNGELELLHADIASSSGQAVSTNTWHTVVVTYDGSIPEFKAYLNGNEVHAESGTHQAPAGDKRVSNNHGGEGRTFKGNLRNLKVYGAVAVGIERAELLDFQLVNYANNEMVQVQASEPLNDIIYKIYAADGRTVQTQALSQNGMISTSGLTSGTHVISLYREQRLIGMRKLITM